MDKIINDLLETDKRSREIEQELEQKRADIPAMIAQRRKELYEQYEKSLNDIIAMTEEEQKKVKDAKVKEIDEKIKQLEDALEKKYAENGDKWIEKIVKEVTGE